MKNIVTIMVMMSLHIGVDTNELAQVIYVCFSGKTRSAIPCYNNVQFF